MLRSDINIDGASRRRLTGNISLTSTHRVRELRDVFRLVQTGLPSPSQWEIRENSMRGVKGCTPRPDASVLGLCIKNQDINNGLDHCKQVVSRLVNSSQNEHCVQRHLALDVASDMIIDAPKIYFRKASTTPGDARACHSS